MQVNVISVLFKLPILLQRMNMIMIVGAFAIGVTIDQTIVMMMMMPMHMIHAKERSEARSPER